MQFAAGGGGAAKRSTVVRFHSDEPSSEDAAEAGGVDAGAGSGIHPSRMAHPMHESHSAPALNLSSAPNPRVGSIAASLPTGNRRASMVAGNLLKQLQVLFLCL